MWEFFRPHSISKEECFPPCRNFSHKVGIFSQFPSYMLRKNPLLVDGRAPRSIWCKKTLWVAVKIFLLLLRESSVMCKAISRKSAETFSFFLQWGVLDFYNFSAFNFFKLNFYAIFSTDLKSASIFAFLIPIRNYFFFPLNLFSIHFLVSMIHFVKKNLNWWTLVHSEWC